jgi:glyoxylase-like metal-dependent hydrolase (beta-lactamase superfamily II)
VRPLLPVLTPKELPIAPRALQLPVGPFQANCYLVCRPDEAACLVIDPGAEPARILHVIEDRELEPIAVLVTHAHIDHVGGLAAVARSTGAPVYSSRREAPWLRELSGAGYDGYADAEPFEPEHLLDGGERLELGPFAVDVRPAPGHSPGSLAFAIDGALYGGDVLFRGSVGRTDLRDGDWPTLAASIAALIAEFPAETPVLPGHGDPTTLGEERVHNPFLAELRA